MVSWQKAAEYTMAASLQRWKSNEVKNLGKPIGRMKSELILEMPKSKKDKGKKLVGFIKKGNLLPTHQILTINSWPLY